MDRLIVSKIHERWLPTTIHCAKLMRTVDGNEKLVMAVSKNNVITVESKIVNDRTDTFIKKYNFAKIPSAADVQSIHCVNKSSAYDDFIFGITYLLTTVVEEVKYDTNHFNVYSGFPGSSLEAIMENCETIKLDFIPIQLDHAIYIRETHKNGMWLLSGYDNRIHAYKSDERQICEEKIEEYFIEFKGTNDEVSVMFDTKSFSDYKKRISFYGTISGFLMFAIVDSEKNQILYSFTEFFLTSVSIVKLFNIHNRTAENQNIFSAAVNDVSVSDVHTINEKEPICFLVGSVVECAVVYMNVLEDNFKNVIVLKDSGQYGGIMSCLIADINFDSKNEILIGTDGEYILSYVYKNNKWVKQLPYDMKDPVFTINYLDITGEGVNDLVVLNKRGVHILKHDPRDIIKILKNRLKP